jgi:hypothetical protein
MRKVVWFCMMSDWVMTTFPSLPTSIGDERLLFDAMADMLSFMPLCQSLLF